MSLPRSRLQVRTAAMIAIALAGEIGKSAPESDPLEKFQPKKPQSRVSWERQQKRMAKQNRIR